MIEVYRRSYAGKNRFIGYADDYNHLFWRLRESDLDAFGYDEFQRHKNGYLFDDCPHSEELRRSIIGVLDIYCYTVYENGKFVTPDRLVGKYRQIQEERYRASRKRLARKRRGRKQAYGGYRKVRTLQERKQSFVQDDEYYVKYRAARNFANLPNPWDDISTHNDKSWKTQSKRKKQWKIMNK